MIKKSDLIDSHIKIYYMLISFKSNYIPPK